ncbi:hypothetical protein BT63DRAFT_132655 [Microthyrium microscopicum]|uniref:Uncharacterized protein n=1 Tax=Microthyrium microscopicum TaxID=703497 RepID=A0A6A6UP11_9PEZI|nr:hypothetical protein BT63DRAFT_132655 [Microthyrium microscopicum]
MESLPAMSKSPTDNLVLMLGKSFTMPTRQRLEVTALTMKQDEETPSSPENLKLNHNLTIETKGAGLNDLDHNPTSHLQSESSFFRALMTQYQHGLTPGFTVLPMVLNCLAIGVDGLIIAVNDLLKTSSTWPAIFPIRDHRDLETRWQEEDWPAVKNHANDFELTLNNFKGKAQLLLARLRFLMETKGLCDDFMHLTVTTCSDVDIVQKLSSKIRTFDLEQEEVLKKQAIKFVKAFGEVRDFVQSVIGWMDEDCDCWHLVAELEQEIGSFDNDERFLSLWASSGTK